MEKIIQFGETVPGYPIAVLNEREIRASAGILFLIIFIGLMLIIFNGDFLLVKYTVTVFLADFIIKHRNMWGRNKNVLPGSSDCFCRPPCLLFWWW